MPLLIDPLLLLPLLVQLLLLLLMLLHENYNDLINQDKESIDQSFIPLLSAKRNKNRSSAPLKNRVVALTLV